MPRIGRIGSLRCWGGDLGSEENGLASARRKEDNVKEPATVDKLCTVFGHSRFAFFAISISFDPYGSLIPRGEPSPSGWTECSRSLVNQANSRPHSGPIQS